MANNAAAERARKLLHEPGTVNEFFRRVEMTPFPEARLRELLPRLVEHWEAAAQCLSVPWPWVASSVHLSFFLFVFLAFCKTCCLRLDLTVTHNSPASAGLNPCSTLPDPL